MGKSTQKSTGPRPLKVQEFLRDGGTLEQLASKYAIAAKRHSKHPNLVLLKYNQIDSPMGSPIVQECRGLILDEAENWRVVSRSFDKFFNEGEGHADDLGESFVVQEKIDGSLLVLYRYKDEWHVQTSGTPDASGQVHGADFTFADLFWKTFKAMGLELPPSEDLCYAFELTSPFNRVVVPHTEPKLTAIGVRDRITGCEYDPSVFPTNWPTAKTFPLDSLKDVAASFEKMDPLKQEGYVMRGTKQKPNGSFPRVKVKHPGYVALHHMRDGLSTKAMVEVVRTGESTEFLTYFPELAPHFNEIKAKYDALISSLEADYERLKSIPVQKDFALGALKTRLSGALFALRAGKVGSIREFVAGMNVATLIGILQLSHQWQEQLKQADTL